jgi:L-aspartate oxidase
VRGHEPWELTPASLPTSVLDGPTPRVGAQRAADTSDEIAIALPRLMWRHVGIVREAAGLEAALAQIRAWRAGGKVPPALSSLLLAAELSASAALLREESRGAHARSDFPRTETAWQRVIAFRRP